MWHCSGRLKRYTEFSRTCSCAGDNACSSERSWSPVCDTSSILPADKLLSRLVINDRLVLSNDRSQGSQLQQHLWCISSIWNTDKSRVCGARNTSCCLTVTAAKVKPLNNVLIYSGRVPLVFTHQYCSSSKRLALTGSGLNKVSRAYFSLSWYNCQ